MHNALVLGAVVAGLALPVAAQAQTRNFDGAWSVEVVTEQGSCDRAYRYNIVVENGRARYGGQENFTVNGQVRSNGQVSANITRGQDRADVRGRLSGSRGTGTWTTAGGRTCSGTWNAEKRG
ncbi:hypothetical protein [Microvirga rosea]|uniref:hypothetical protein n=1 Tax=Microvirga rosea TaxID=2715425 RepID=UPI001D0B4703|nr:hypothetical protein [Microvirga rosea]MCB8820116.1 hypothetical protein [Microvirga rosea]